ncbi:MAG: tetratricopeptide repeat protein [Elusimicrobiota bacterium]
MRFLTLVLLLACAPAFAAFEDLGAGARAPGMGNAFTAVADDVYAIHYNPAGLALLSRPELGTSYSKLLLGLSDNSNLSSSFIGYAHPLKQGEKGTAGFSWERFSLDSLYQEQSLTFSYGRLLTKDLGPGSLYGGLNLKYLNRSFGSFPEATNGCSGIACNKGVDPVLSGKKSAGAIDTDLGFLYKLRRRYSFGLAVLHVNQPNVAFAANDSDKLPMAVKLGAAYQSLLSNLAVETDFRRSPLGTMDQIFTVALERWFPRLFVGDFGVRGGLSLGSRDFKQLTTGASYRTGRLGFDYGFSLPIGGIASSGAHRLALSVRFGSMQEADESIELILDAMRKLKSGKMPELKSFGQGLSGSQKLLLDEYLARATSLEAQAKYREALDQVSQALTVSPSDAALLKGFGRLNFVAQAVKELPEYKANPVQAAWHQGILGYLDGNDALAVDKVSYAFGMDPTDRALDAFLSQLELATGLKRLEHKKPAPERYELEQKLTKAASALEDGRYEEVIELSLAVVREDPNNLTAWENLGTAYFATADYTAALNAWEKAYALQTEPSKRSVVKGYLRSIRSILSRPRPPKPVRPAMEPRATASPEEVQQLYNRGVDYYTAGQLEKAKQTFEQVLRVDPSNVPAEKALKRVNEELAPK